MVKDRKITSEEWNEISFHLEGFHAIFYQFWILGKPRFTEKIETACIVFNKEGKHVDFLFNPEFWDKLDLKSKLFVICHECLHVILNHGVRIRDSEMRDICNIALDVVVNESLLDNFNFNKDEIFDHEKLCWLDTVFPDKKVPKDASFEFYYNEIKKNVNVIKISGVKLVDDHGGLPSNGDGSGEDEDKNEKSGNWSEILKKINESLSQEEKKEIKDLINRKFEQDPKEQQAGSGTGEWTFVHVQKPIIKRKWETIIKKWSKKYLTNTFKETEQWARINRRMTMLNSNMFIPTDMETDDLEQENKKIQVYFFLDTSGSCIGLKDRFFEAAQSLPPKKFDLRLFCFDTQVEETTLASKKIYGGGGTSFSILEEFIQKEMNQAKTPYPEAVFIITDGYGNMVNPAKPEKWHWFLTEFSATNYIPKDSKIFKLKDYE